MTTGQRIYEARKKAGMTQEELADRLGVSRQAVSKWESDAAYPETDKIVELCKLFSLSADELLLGAESAPRTDAPNSAKKTNRCSIRKRCILNTYQKRASEICRSCTSISDWGIIARRGS